HQVASEDERVDLVEPGGVEELPVGGLRTVDVTRVEESRRLGGGLALARPQRHAYSSSITGASSPTSRYHFFRSPTRARILQPSDFGSASIRASESETCSATRAFSSSDSCGYEAAICSTFLRFIGSVRHQPQSRAHTAATREMLMVSPSVSPSGCSSRSMMVSTMSFSLISTICIFCMSISASGIV